jgi:light-regulated signal transduction histidine kinase (bacteriophytochrome)
VTQLVEDITIKITLNHCEGDSTVLGGPIDLRGLVASRIEDRLHSWLQNRQMQAVYETKGISVKFENTGLYEAPETGPGGGDN